MSFFREQELQYIQRKQKQLQDGEYFYVVLNLLREYEQQEAAADCRCGMRFSDWVRQWLVEREKRLDPVTWQGYDLTAKCPPSVRTGVRTSA